MPDNSIAAITARKPFEWFEDDIPIRGNKISKKSVSELYSELGRINLDFGRKLVASLPKDPKMTKKQWEEQKAHWLEDAFQLTIYVTSDRDLRVVGEGAEFFDSEDFPEQIKGIYITNITAFRRNANGVEPANKIDVLLDFDKPSLIDPNILASEATPNQSKASIRANDLSFVRAIQQVINTKLNKPAPWHAGLHKDFSYDLGLWVVALPLALFFANYYADIIFPESSSLATYRWAFIVYTTGLSLIIYRFLTSYAKWAFPVNVFKENRDTAVRHRVALTGAVSWLLYKFADAIYVLL